jgi:putative ABC transport system permease protein
VIIALQGTLLGLLVGVFFGWALVRAQQGNGISVFNVPWLTLIIMVLLAGVVAAILPAAGPPG